MKRTMKDRYGEEAMVTSQNGSRRVYLRLKCFSESSRNHESVCHIYTPAQARRMAALLTKAADELDAAKRKQLKAGMP